MGVKDLWSVLSPICERKSLWELENKSIAVDLSAWICDSNSFSTPQTNMYLRNLFFRTNYLLLLGVKPIFVLEGEAPAVKEATIRKRMGKGQNKDTSEAPADKSKKYIRSRLKGLQTQCVELLNYMGIKCVKGRGEAEAYCAHLNARGVVCGVVTQDSDAFLYGAEEVYRNFQMGPNYTCDCYRMDNIKEKLGLSRTKLVGFCILSGSDYNGGVNKVGKQSALKFLSTLRDDQVYQKFIEWKNSPQISTTNKQQMCSDLQLELSIKSKALQDEGFPHMDVIAEFTAPIEEGEFTWEWHKPDVHKFISFAARKLMWDDKYALDKFIPLLGRWHLEHPYIESVISVDSLLKWRQQETEQCSFKVHWSLKGIETEKPAFTWERENVLMKGYSHLVHAYRESKRKKPKPRKEKKIAEKPTKEKKTTENPIRKPRKKAKVVENDNVQTITLDKYFIPQAINNLQEVEEIESDSENYMNLSNIVAGIISRETSNPALLSK